MLINIMLNILLMTPAFSSMIHSSCYGKLQLKHTSARARTHAHTHTYARAAKFKYLYLDVGPLFL